MGLVVGDGTPSPGLVQAGCERLLQVHGTLPINRLIRSAGHGIHSFLGLVLKLACPGLLGSC